MERALLDAAAEARKCAYAPYSGFAVGAAIQAEDGTVYTGCNVENASYPATCCAERVALGTAIAAGARSFKKIAIVGGRAGEAPRDFCMPCGICRQVLSEFCAPSLEILVTNGEQDASYRLDALLPYSFSQKSLEE